MKKKLKKETGYMIDYKLHIPFFVNLMAKKNVGRFYALYSYNSNISHYQ
ncbi:MAG: hypothetical protein LBG15_16770 [Dysgonamonadaceae bacterium]|nr:hypothetical protein [Dysgonamonadaceae bacterium]